MYFLVPWVFLRAVPGPTVALRPLGGVDPVDIQEVADHLRFVAKVTVLPPEPLPSVAYYPPRQRFRGDTLLDFLERDTPVSYSRVIGITSQDISVTRGEIYDWGVFGVSQLSGRPAIVSTYRLRVGGASPEKTRCRLDNVALHELGHTLGLPHCTTKGCVMNDAHGSIRPVDESTGDFCAACAARLASILCP